MSEKEVRAQASTSNRAKAQPIQLLILDVDGVLTDGKIFMLPDGETLVGFHVHDGAGIKNLQALGVTIAIISGRNTKSVRHRLEQLGIRHIFLGEENKLIPYNALIDQLKLNPDQVAYMGDDVADIPPMEKAGLSITVPNAIESVKKIATYCTQKTGGNGAVREVCDLIQQAKRND